MWGFCVKFTENAKRADCHMQKHLLFTSYCTKISLKKQSQMLFQSTTVE